MLLPTIILASPLLVGAAQTDADFARCVYSKPGPIRPVWMVRLLRRQGATLTLKRATVIRRIGELRTHRTRYVLYYYVHDTPTAGSCHGIDAIVVLRDDRLYVGSYHGIGPSTCRIGGDTLFCRDAYFGRDFPVRFVGGKPPRNTVIGGDDVELAR
jgi:hypothetical protein